VRAQFGTKPIAALWPERFSLNFLAKQKRWTSAASRAAHGQAGAGRRRLFQGHDIVPYHSMDELPKNLRKYGASDHAVTEKQKNDASVMGCVGIDDNDDIWVLPDLVWDRMETDGIVEALLAQFKAHKPQLWWMESELISKSFGPFLRKRMVEEQIYTTIDPVTVAKDKKSRARSIQGRMRMHKVHFPVFAPWWNSAHKKQLSRFPVWRRMTTSSTGWRTSAWADEGSRRFEAEENKVVRVGSVQWMLAQTKTRATQESKRRQAGW
jgi:predicted phage terminase large subunit-like protein